MAEPSGMPYANGEKRERECHVAPAAWKTVIPPISIERTRA